MERKDFQNVFSELEKGKSLAAALREAKVWRPIFYDALRHDIALVEQYANAVRTGVLAKYGKCR